MVAVVAGGPLRDRRNEQHPVFRRYLGHSTWGAGGAAPEKKRADRTGGGTNTLDTKKKLAVVAGGSLGDRRNEETYSKYAAGVRIK